ncbi:MAG: hypothetical protein NTY19_00220 [Planctomycetota bacterium]|nr:hypothetical protein [Planctomycetota bacterium]
MAARASALGQLQRHAEALRDWDEVIQADTDPRSNRWRLQRARSLVARGEHQPAVAEVEEGNAVKYSW